MVDIRRPLFVMAPAVIGISLLGSACVPTTLQLAEGHPARSGAEPGVSADAAAILRPQAGLDAGATELTQEAPPAEPDGSRDRPFVGHGVVRDAGAGTLIIQHQAIPGFMGAMTMGFPVSGEVDLERIGIGDEIMFLIESPESGGFRIFEVERMQSSAVPSSR